MLKVAKIAIKASYTQQEVCNVLGMSKATFYRHTKKYQKSDGKHVCPDSLFSYKVGASPRVPYQELVDFLHRNNTYERGNR